MALIANMNQAGGNDCLIVCQTNGEMDIPTRLIKTARRIVMFLYKSLGQPALRVAALGKVFVSFNAGMTSIKADVMRFLDYKSANGPNRA
jgi:hypothetical protein